MIGDEENSFSSESSEVLIDEEEHLDILPLYSTVPGVDWSSHSSHWVLRKVDEIKNLHRISCEGYED